MATDFWNRYYKQLEGVTIVKYNGIINEDEDLGIFQGFPSFTVKKNNQTFDIEISADEEGNGGCVIFGLEFPQ